MKYYFKKAGANRGARDMQSIGLIFYEGHNINDRKIIVDVLLYSCTIGHDPRLQRNVMG
jgi:hypothetical protein